MTTNPEPDAERCPPMLHRLLIERAATTPTLPAIRCGSATVTYGQLERLVDRTARLLLAEGVLPGDRVALWLDKSIAVVAAMQAALRIGAVYVPIDPQSPAPRVARITACCEPAVVLTNAARAIELAAAAPGTHCLAVDGPAFREAFLDEGRGPELPELPQDPDGMAYVLYTSGATGSPKGVCISHRNAMAFVTWAAEAVGATGADRFANHAPLHFDLSVFDIYVSLLVGGCVSLIPANLSLAPGRLVDLIADHGITVWYSVPSVLTMMMNRGGLLVRPIEPPRVVIFAGEAFPIVDLHRMRGAWPETRMFNFYGPTETNVCTAHEVREIHPERVEPIPIGAAASGNRVWLESDDGSPVPDGETGELIVDGPTVMLGYWDQGMTLRSPYRTGDLARRNADGDFELIGRRDQVLEVRGHRVEAGEVESVLLIHPAVREAAVLVEGIGREARLVAVIAGDERLQVGLLQLKRHCASFLPPSMIVDRVRWLPALPRNSNGKIDRNRIAALLAAGELRELVASPSPAPARNRPKAPGES